MFGCDAWLKSRKTIERIEFFWEVLTVQGWMANSEGDSASQKDRSIYGGCWRWRYLFIIEEVDWTSKTRFQGIRIRVRLAGQRSDQGKVGSQKQTLTLPLSSVRSSTICPFLCRLSCHAILSKILFSKPKSLSLDRGNMLIDINISSFASCFFFLSFIQHLDRILSLHCPCWFILLVCFPFSSPPYNFENHDWDLSLC